MRTTIPTPRTLTCSRTLTAGVIAGVLTAAALMPAEPSAAERGAASGNRAGGGSGPERIPVCHAGRGGAAHTIVVHRRALERHLAHGDILGRCPDAEGLQSIDSARAEDEEMRETIAVPPDRERIAAIESGDHLFDPDEMAQCIDAVFAPLCEVGYAYVIVKDGDLAASNAHGLARGTWEDEEPGVVMEDATRMTIASISKPLTAVALMRVVEMTRNDPDPVEIEDPFADWIDPNIFTDIHADVANVTIRQLLTHHSGLMINQSSGQQCQEDDLQLIVSLEPSAVVNPAYNYQNANYCLIRRVIEGATGRDYIEFVSNEILAPMGITEMSCKAEPVGPTLYYRFDPGIQALPNPQQCEPDQSINSTGQAFTDFEATCSAYGWFASAFDLGAFLAHFRADTVLEPQSRQTMLETCDPNNSGTEYCLGWGRAERALGTYYRHTGGWGLNGKGFRGVATFMPFGVSGALIVNTRQGLPSPREVLWDCYESAFDPQGIITVP